MRTRFGWLRRWLVISCGIALYVTPPQVQAAGLFLQGIGTRAQSMGGAFVAGGDDLTVMWHNPANLSRLKGVRVLLDGALVWSPFTFQREPLGGMNNPFPSTVNLGGPQPIPFIGVSYDFGALKLPKMHKLAIGIAVWAPYDGNYVWDQDESGQIAQPECRGAQRSQFICNKNGPQRYSLQQFDPTQIYLGAVLSYGIQLPFMSIHVGGGFQLRKTDIFQSLTVKLISDNLTDTSDDTEVRVNVGSEFQPSGNVGLTVAFPFGLSIGGSFQFGGPVPMNGTLEAVIPEAFESLASLEGNEATVNIVLPWIARAGIAYQPSFFKRLRAEVAFVYEAWSVFEAIELDPSKIRVNTPLPTIPSEVPKVTLPRNWRDTWSIRTGAQIEIIERYLFARLGYFYETSAPAPQNFNVSSVHGERHVLSVGLEGRIPIAKKHHLRIAASFSHAFVSQLVVTDSAERVVILTRDEQAIQSNPVVGNGTYSPGTEIFLLSLSYSFDG